MSSRALLRRVRLPLTGLISCLAIAQVQAVTITSNNFSLGFGATFFAVTANPPTWTTLETNDANTPDTGTVGVDDANGTAIAVSTDFNLTPTVLGESFSASGATFPGRVLTSAGSDRAGYSINFEAILAAAYTGTLPGGATNVMTTLNVTDISIYVSRFNSGVTDSFQILELATASGSTPLTGIPNAGGSTGQLSNTPNYSQAVWNPAELAAIGTSASRTFRVTGFGDNAATALYAIEGFEVEGNIAVTFDIIPEPSSLTMLICGAAAILRNRRRK